ncbi:transposase [Micromonospora sp. II]|uniref:Insertion element IS402-like domain-containing protein n=1 Tax=Micromonospora chalcea TaxID=1874 RepID=A0ABX9Y3J2_MICCH|nr:hypothetical protein DLJ60_21820 [Micromonospora chalcea]RQX12472.1 hypothetical protein DLJ57_31775 [Micromonospora chalcea]
MTDAQRALIQPLLEPTPAAVAKHPRREIVNVSLYMVRSGCPWRYPPTDHRRGRRCTGTSSAGKTAA